MKSIDQIRVSFYENVYSKSPAEVSLLSVLEQIVKGEHAPKINTIRRYHAEGANADAQKLKSALPCFTASGTFTGAHAVRNLDRHSGIILIDYDHVADIDGMRRVCAADPHTVTVFQSPTDGLKVAAYVENARGRHREAYHLVSNYYDRLTGLRCDAACKDESRLCYVSYDPRGYIAALYEAFRLAGQGTAVPSGFRPVIQPQTDLSDTHPGAEPRPQTDFSSKNTGAETGPNPDLAGTVPEFVKSYFFLNPPTRGNRHTVLFKLACQACRKGYPEETLSGELCARMQAGDFTEKEIRDTLAAGYKHIRSDEAAPRFRESAGFEKDKRTKVQLDTLPEETDADEAYWQGEEFRRNTPLFPPFLYENIPELLDECILEDLTARERDLLLLSCLTAYSAVLPQTWGIYDKRRFSPHLYCVSIAPAGSGKSIVQLGRMLLNSLQDHILQESEAARKTYKTRHLEWQLAYARKVKSKDAAEKPEEPQEPPYRMLVIPATTSYTRMQMQLRDNAGLGGIIFDTEAQTLANANSLDCGHFDDMLCKAFGHETISSSYKANGLKPIVVRCPRLALCLTGTPEQFYQLVVTPESGLFSRMLLYTFRENPVWKEMGDEGVLIDDLFESLSERTHRLYLFCREHPLQFSFTRNQWNRINREFGTLLSEVAGEGNDNLQAVVKRHAFLVMRVAMIFTRLRQFRQNDFSAESRCGDTDFDTALTLVRCCYEHSRLLMTSMPAPQKHVLKDPNRTRRFFEELPAEFTTDQAIRLAEKHDIGRRRVSRLLKESCGLKIKKIAHGRYKKFS